MKKFEQKRHAVMIRLFWTGWALFAFAMISQAVVGYFAWWNVAPFAVSMLLLFVSSPYINVRIWRSALDAVSQRKSSDDKA